MVSVDDMSEESLKTFMSKKFDTEFVEGELNFKVDKDGIECNDKELISLYSKDSLKDDVDRGADRIYLLDYYERGLPEGYEFSVRDSSIELVRK